MFTGQVNALLPWGWPPAIGVVKGTAAGGWTTKLTVMCVGTVVYIAYALSQGFPPIPAIGIVYVFFLSFRPPRIVAVTPSGLISYSRWGRRQRAKEVVGTTDLGPILVADGPATMQIGDDKVTFRGAEYTTLQRLTSEAQSTFVS